jgi:hypothetical protein
MAELARSQFPADVLAPRPRSTIAERGARNRQPQRRSNTGPEARLIHYARRRFAFVWPVLCGIVVIAAISIGWVNSSEEYITPKNGVGYWLGIAGASVLLLLLVYPLRKRVKSLRAIGGVAFWFRSHMLLGILGPVLILFHTNFALGALNSNVALFAMLLVATSGIFGRYLYGKLHLGLYGRKAEVKEVIADADALMHQLAQDLTVADHIVRQLAAFSEGALRPRRGALASALALPLLGIRSRVLRGQLLARARRLIKAEGRRRGWSWGARRQRVAATTNLVTLYLAAVRKAAALAFYDRLFSLWHALHLPLFWLLLFAAIVHVVAVHLY